VILIASPVSSCISLAAASSTNSPVDETGWERPPAAFRFDPPLHEHQAAVEHDEYGCGDLWILKRDETACRAGASYLALDGPVYHLAPATLAIVDIVSHSVTCCS
jgi:hypothetical protein